MVVARSRARKVLVVGPLAVETVGKGPDGMTMRVGGRGLEAALSLREMGCAVELATALNARTFMGRYAVGYVRDLGLGVSKLVHDESLNDLSSYGNCGWGGSRVLAGMMDQAVSGRDWVVCDGGLGTCGLARVGRAVGVMGASAVGMVSGSAEPGVLEACAGWRGLCLDGEAWNGGEGRNGKRMCAYEALSRKLVGTAVRVEAGNGVALTLMDGEVVTYGVWRGLGLETASLAVWLMGAA